MAKQEIEKSAGIEQSIEEVLMTGNLSELTPAERLGYYRKVCESLGLNPYTRPFDYITLNGRLTLYARKDAAEQLRKIYSVSVGKPDVQFIEDWIMVTVLATTPDGRTDSNLGIVSRKDMSGNFGNAVMKAVTKAKRRVTLSICGLGMLDETEVETIPGARDKVPMVVVNEEGELAEVTETTVISKPNGRPYKPEVLMDKLASRAKANSGKPLSYYEWRLFGSMLDVLVQGDENDLEALLVNLFGVQDIEMVPNEMVLAGLGWIDAKKDSGGGYVPNSFAVQEAVKVLEHSRVDETVEKTAG